MVLLQTAWQSQLKIQKQKLIKNYNVKISNRTKALVFTIFISIIILFSSNFSFRDNLNLEVQNLIIYNIKNSKNTSIENYKIGYKHKS